MKKIPLVCCLLALASTAVSAATRVASYDFNNTLAANEPGAPALVATDPLDASGFVNDTVQGQTRPVWAFDGLNSPTNEQAGLTVSTAGLIAPRNYSVDMVLQFTQRPTGWRRIIDVENRQSDDGFYVDPSSHLYVYPVVGATTEWTNDSYHHVVLTNDGTQVNAYLDGSHELMAATDLMNIDNPNNPDSLMHFFLDNVVAGGQGEFSDGSVAHIGLWQGILTSTESMEISSINPFLKGDINRDGHVNATDILAMEGALADLPGYQLRTGANAQQLKDVADINGDNKVNNADLQKLLSYLIAGNGSNNAVPEPGTGLLAILAGVGGWFVCATARGKR
jgi:hypothetical protein